MRQIFDLTGSQVMQEREYDIAAGTAITVGQAVKLSAGLVVAASAAETGPILGYAAENHSGTADALDHRANGKRIKVQDSPTAVAESLAPVVTATDGSASTIVDSTLATFADDDFNGGYVKLVAKAADSNLKETVGTVYRITDFTAATKTITIDKASSEEIVAGDQFAVFPPIGFVKGNFNAGITGLVLTATAALPVKVIGRDEDRQTIHTMAALHELGNKKA